MLSGGILSGGYCPGGGGIVRGDIVLIPKQTNKHEHSHKPPHFQPNPFNLFTNISHFESFHLFPSSCLSVSPHLLLFINSSSIRFRPRSSYPPSLFPSLSHGTLILLLMAGDVELNPGPSSLNHLNIRSIRSFQNLIFFTPQLSS